MVGPSEQPPGPQVLRLGLGGLKPPPSLHGVPTLTLLWPGASLERGKLRPREGPRQKYPDSQATICTPGPASYSRRKIQRGRALAVLTAAHKGHQGRGRGQSDPGRILEGFKGEVVSESGL